MSEPPDLSAEALGLAMRLLEQDRPIMSAQARELMRPDIIAALIDACFLMEDGHEAGLQSEADHDDVPVAVHWSPEHQAYGYFSESGGWVIVDRNKLVALRLDVLRLLRALFVADDRLATGVVEVVPHQIWDVGEIRVPGRSRRISIWFARKARREWESLAKALQIHPAVGSRVVLTSTPERQLPKLSIGPVPVLPIDGILSPTTGTVDLQKLARYLDRPSSEAELVRLIGDGREVWAGGRTYHFPKGEQQRRIVRYLHGRLITGESRVSSAEIVGELDLPLGTRIRDVFKKSPAWGHLLDEAGGMCFFCVAVHD